jgi:hypothetical protein
MTDTVLLPDGTVFLVNGIAAGSAGGYSFKPVSETEIFDPAEGTFAEMARLPGNPRCYHATAVLLPSGQVAVAGNTYFFNQAGAEKGLAQDDDRTIAIFNPPYLFRGNRPVLLNGRLPSAQFSYPTDGRPPWILYGEQFTIQSDIPITRVMMMRPCAVTHSVDSEQRAIWLIRPDPGRFDTFEIPKSATLAPPGYYMLFFISGYTGNFIPSTGYWMQLRSAPPPSPALSLAEEVAKGLPVIPGMRQIYTQSPDGRSIIVTMTQGPTSMDVGTVEHVLNVGTNGSRASDNGTPAWDFVNDGDIVVHSRVRIQSRRGSITVNNGISDWCHVQLKAKTFVRIGGGETHKSIAGNCVVVIKAEEFVQLDRMVDNYSEVSIRSGYTVNDGYPGNQLVFSPDEGEGAPISGGDGHTTIGGDDGYSIRNDSTVTVNATGPINVEAISDNAHAYLQAVNGVIDINGGIRSGACCRLVTNELIIVRDIIAGEEDNRQATKVYWWVPIGGHGPISAIPFLCKGEAVTLEQGLLQIVAVGPSVFGEAIYSPGLALLPL